MPNLYYGGCGKYQTFAVADDLESAKTKIGLNLKAPYLSIECEIVDEVDGFKIVPMTEIESFARDNTPQLRHCKKCEFTTTSQGELMRHCAEVHPKGA